MDNKAIGLLLIIGAVIFFVKSSRNQMHGRASFLTSFILGCISFVLLIGGFMLMSK